MCCCSPNPYNTALQSFVSSDNKLEVDKNTINRHIFKDNQAQKTYLITVIPVPRNKPEIIIIEKDLNNRTAYKIGRTIKYFFCTPKTTYMARVIECLENFGSIYRKRAQGEDLTDSGAQEMLRDGKIKKYAHRESYYSAVKRGPVEPAARKEPINHIHQASPLTPNV
ncbi:hypothetical protein D5R81_11070 [Parashewanella spongiae]|uniref:Uncharacterized protein n=1 Tax=Parashewanella spongiae TaxID=342950 RepID=A0A3A6TSS1_9GAMM|nr:hypothetical protein [Parashewanella spongiae]MCL1078464.1 hypothetical protein [Parashewanella spongiae]RJY14607.1 hypothetical protein D5R81_11070 [Parashewanella spongiae]